MSDCKHQYDEDMSEKCQRCGGEIPHGYPTIDEHDKLLSPCLWDNLGDAHDDYRSLAKLFWEAEARVKELEDIVHGIGNLLEENGHTVTFTLKANRLITKCHELFRTENK
jgi:hypothetical protein